MSKKHNDSSDSEKNFGINDNNTDEPSTSAFQTEDDFLDLADDEEQPAKVSDRNRTVSNIEEAIWGSDSFDLDQLHQLRELYNTRQKKTEEDDEQEYLDAIKERNTDELEQLRHATAVLEQFEVQPYIEEPSTSKSGEPRRIRPQRFLAGAGRYHNKLMNREKQDEVNEIEELDEGIEEEVKQDKKEILSTALGGKTQVVKHKKISREVAKLRFSNPGTAFKDNFNLNEDGQSALALDVISQRATRRAKADASERMRGVTSIQTRSKSERLSEPLTISPQRLPQQPKNVIYHNEAGELVVNGEISADLCDCLTEECSGCFFACPNCNSNKCGPICRSRRSQFAYCVAEPRQKTIQPVRFNQFRRAIQREQTSPEKCS